MGLAAISAASHFLIYTQSLVTLQKQHLGILTASIFYFGLSSVTFVAHGIGASKKVTFGMSTASTALCVISNIALMCLKKRPVKKINLHHQQYLGDIELQNLNSSNVEAGGNAADNEYTTIVNVTTGLIDEVLNETTSQFNTNFDNPDTDELKTLLRLNFAGEINHYNYETVVMNKLQYSMNIAVLTQQAENGKYKLVIECTKGVELSNSQKAIDFDTFARAVTTRVNSNERATINYSGEFSFAYEM